MVLSTEIEKFKREVGLGGQVIRHLGGRLDKVLGLKEDPSSNPAADTCWLCDMEQVT